MCKKCGYLYTTSQVWVARGYLAGLGSPYTVCILGTELRFVSKPLYLQSHLIALQRYF